MKNFLLMLLGKETSGSVDDAVNGVFKSECYYDWIKLNVICKPKDSSEDNPEVLLIASYDEEIKSRQRMINNGLHVQQGIIAIPADDNDDEDSYNKFLEEINNGSVIFISFINIYSWIKKEKIIKSGIPDKSKNINETAKMKILEIIDKQSMRLFHTFDHNDFVMICNGTKTELKNYLKTLEKIRTVRFMEDHFAIHDITTIYGYKSSIIDELDESSSLSAVVSVSGHDIAPFNVTNSFKMEAIGRYDYLYQYPNISWRQFSKMSKELHGDNVVTSRVHIGCNTSAALTTEPFDENFSVQNPSPLYSDFEKIYNEEISSIDFQKLVELYGGDEKYVDSIKLLLKEIGLSISITLKRGFSKYNSVCYIEPYIFFVKYIKEKIIDKFCKNSQNDSIKDCDSDENLAEKLVDMSNSFYKSILTLDSSIMHSERRFIMSDPYQLMLFDVPPKLIAYYTAIANEMARTLNNGSQNKYVFLITPDIKKDIYVESITDNRDIGDEINILIIHINERSIYSITDTTKILAHEIAHHVGQDEELRKTRSYHFIKCYIALLIKRCLDPDVFGNCSNVNDVILIIEKIVDDIFELIKDSEFIDDINKYYYLDELQDNFYYFLSENMTDIKKVDKALYEILLNHISDKIVTDYANKEQFFFTKIKECLSSDEILKGYVYRRILETAYDNLQRYLYNQRQIIEDLECVRFVFKEGYADMRMISLTENFNSYPDKIIENYSKLFNCVNDKTDEIVRKCAVTNALLNNKDERYDDIINSDLIKNETFLEQAYYIYICKQSALYFMTIKKEDQDRQHNKAFDFSKTLLFKKGETSEIIRQVDNTIKSYVYSIL